MKPKKISVIVTAHNRSEYLLRAFKSITSQTLAPEFIEIVLVKNFRDSEIDNVAEKIHIKNVFTNADATGDKIALGIENSTGEVISFLDDDDEFVPEKLSEVLKIFSEHDIGLYHNECIQVDSSGVVLKSGLANNAGSISYSLGEDPKKFKELCIARASYNMSSLSVNRGLAEELAQVFRVVKYNVDGDMIFVAADRGFRILADSKKLTRVTIHNSTSRNAENQDMFREVKTKFMERSASSLELLEKHVGHKEVKLYVNSQIWELRMLINLLETGKYKGLLRPSTVLDSMKLFPRIYILKILAATFMARFFPERIRDMYFGYWLQNREW